MIKVKLRPTKRLFESEDADFMIQGKEEKVLPDRVLRSYHVKNYLINGHLKLTEGELVIKVKSANLLFSADHPTICYGVEYGKFFKRNLDLETTEWFHHLGEEVPADIKLKLLGEIPAEPEMSDEEIDAEIAESIDLEDMSKAELQDEADELGIEYTTKDTKAILIEKIKAKMIEEFEDE